MGSKTAQVLSKMSRLPNTSLFSITFSVRPASRLHADLDNNLQIEIAGLNLFAVC